MKLPNGYGSVYKMKGKRRRPYIIMKNKKTIGYAKTKEEGLQILAEYNKEPWDVDLKRATFSDVYELWLKYKSDNIGEHTRKNYIGKYKNHCQALYDLPYCELKTFHFTEIIERSGGNNGTKNNLLKLLRELDRTALEYGIIQVKNTDFIKFKPIEYNDRLPFSEKEIELLWENVEAEDVDLVLILIYTGMRSGELCSLKTKDIDLENRILVGGNKTAAGKNRKIPIHKRIVPLIEKRMGESKKDTLLNYGGNQFRKRFKWVMEKLGLKHVPHECRHTLRTRLDDAGANKVCIDLIMGHKSSEVGERIYTHKTIKQLFEAMDLIE